MKLSYFDAKYDYLVWVDYLIATYGKENVILVHPMVERMTTEKAQKKLELLKLLAEVFGVKLYCGDYLGLAESTVIQIYNDVNEYETEHTDAEIANDYCVKLSKRYKPDDSYRMFADSVVSMYANIFGIPKQHCTYMFKERGKSEVSMERVFKKYPELNAFKESFTI